MRRRRIQPGEEYTIDEDVELEIPDPDPDPPPENTRGEPWGWPEDKSERPRGFPGPTHSRDDPGPFDGRWERDNDSN